MRAHLLLGLLLTACTQLASAPTRAPASDPSPEPAEAPEPESAPAETDTSDPIADAHAIIAAEIPDGRWISDKERAALKAKGLDAKLAMAALNEVARRCAPEGKCEGEAPDRHTVEVLLSVVEDEGTPQVLPALIQLDARQYLASIAIEHILRREMIDDLEPCAPPSAAEIAAAREKLEDFEILDRDGGRLVSRAPTPAELDDLAYFLAGVADSDPAIGEGGPAPLATTATPTKPDPVDTGRRARELAALDEALRMGQLDEARTAATTYLTSLGYPGAIDAAREAEYAWGGARFSYVMRDLATVSEIVGEYTVAADLYVRANPGGGACGTSVSAREGDQLRGLIRVQERAGQCRAVVAHRLLDWDGRYDPGDEKKADFEPGYGPGRLARDGWDLTRMYRGALLTRNRTEDNWEHRVRAAEGLADIGGRAALDELVALLPKADDALRERLLVAIGEMTERAWAGPCPEDGGWISLGGYSNIWSRRVSRIGNSCKTRLTDDEAAAVAAAVLPYAKDKKGSDDVRHAAMKTIGQLAVPAQRKIVTRWYRRARAQERRACAHVQEHMYDEACEAAKSDKWAADDAYEQWIVAVDHLQDFEHDDEK